MPNGWPGVYGTEPPVDFWGTVGNAVKGSIAGWPGVVGDSAEIAEGTSLGAEMKRMWDETGNPLMTLDERRRAVRGITENAWTFQEALRRERPENRPILQRLFPSIYTDPENPPFTTRWFGERLGADTESGAFNLGSMFSPSGAAKALSGMGSSVLGTLIGVRGAERLGMVEGESLLGSLDEAKALLAGDAHTHEEVFNRTGWWLDEQDGAWKFQLRHWENAKIRPELIETITSRLKRNPHYDANVRLDEVLDYPDLFTAYPEIRTLRVNLAGIFDDASGMAEPTGAYTPGWGIEMESSIQRLKDGMIHEVEHVVQDLEDFGAGGQGFGKNMDVTRLGDRIEEISERLANINYRNELLGVAEDAPIELLRKSPDDFIQWFGDTGYKLTAREAVDIRAIMQDGLRDPDVWEANRDILELNRSIVTQHKMFLEGLFEEVKDMLPIDAVNRIRLEYYNTYRSLAGESIARLAEDLEYRYEMGLLGVGENPFPPAALEEMLQSEAARNVQSLRNPPTELTPESLVISDYLNPTQKPNIERLMRLEERRRQNLAELELIQATEGAE